MRLTYPRALGDAVKQFTVEHRAQTGHSAAFRPLRDLSAGRRCEIRAASRPLGHRPIGKP